MSHPYGIIEGMSKPHQIVKNGMSLTAFFNRYPTDREAEAQFKA